MNCSIGLVVVKCYELAANVESLYSFGPGHGLPKNLKCSNVLAAGYRAITVTLASTISIHIYIIYSRIATF